LQRLPPILSAFLHVIHPLKLHPNCTSVSMWIRGMAEPLASNWRVTIDAQFSKAKELVFHLFINFSTAKSDWELPPELLVLGWFHI
jgi:hypothetical protein